MNLTCSLVKRFNISIISEQNKKQKCSSRILPTKNKLLNIYFLYKLKMPLNKYTTEGTSISMYQLIILNTKINPGYC
jgi:hypothetical protein